MRNGFLLLLLLASLACAEQPITLMGADGADVDVRPAEGQVLLLHFWATWCPSCVQEFEHLQNAASQCSEEQIRVLSVNVGEEDEIIRKFVHQYGVRLPVLRDPTADVWRATGANGLPANLFWSDIGRRIYVGSKNAMQWESLFAVQGCSPPSPPPRE